MAELSGAGGFGVGFPDMGAPIVDDEGRPTAALVVLFQRLFARSGGGVGVDSMAVQQAASSNTTIIEALMLPGILALEAELPAEPADPGLLVGWGAEIPPEPQDFLMVALVGELG